MLLSSISLVSAYHYGPDSPYINSPYSSGYGYNRPFSYLNNVAGNLDFTRNSFDLNRNNIISNRNALTSNNRYSNLNQDFRSLSFLDSILQQLNQDSDLNLRDGYDFNKGPCVTKNVRVNFHGKDNDFQIFQEICDNIEGNFFRDNRYSNTLSNSANTNRGYFGTNFINNRNFNEGFINQDVLNQNALSESLSQSSNKISTSFGKGDIVVFN